MWNDWNWTEVLEGTFVSLIFVVIPLLIRIEKHNNSAKVRHKEVMDAHKDHEKHLKELTNN